MLRCRGKRNGGLYVQNMLIAFSDRWRGSSGCMWRKALGAVPQEAGEYSGLDGRMKSDTRLSCSTMGAETILVFTWKGA